MRSIQRFALALTVLSFCCHAIYEDQVDEFDWQRQNIGQVKRTVYSSTSPKSIYCATHQNALAKIASKDGTLRWRQMLPKEEGLDDILLTDTGLVSLSGDGKYVRMWDTADGSLIWDAISYSASDRDNAAAAAASTSSSYLLSMSDRLVIASNNGVTMMDVTTGYIRWRWDFAEGSFGRFLGLLAEEEEERLYVLDGASRVHQLNSADGTLIGSTTAVSTTTSPAVLVRNEAGHVCVVSITASHEIAVFDVTMASASVPAVSATDFVPNVESIRGIVRLSDTFFALQIAEIESRNALKLGLSNNIQALGRKDGIHGAATAANGKEFIGMISQVAADTKSIGLDLQPAEAEDAEEDLTSTVALDTLYREHGPIQQVFPIIFDKQHTLTYRLLVVMQDHALLMFSADHLLWTREEGLGSIDAAEWITPADERERETTLTKIPSFTESLALQCHELQHFLSTFSLDSLGGGSHADKSHFFGFSKYIIALSHKAGKIYAIQSETGQIAWARKLEPQDNDYKLIITREQPGLGGTGPELLLLSRRQAVWMDAQTGVIMETQPFVTEFAQAFVLPHHKHHMNEEASTTRRAVVLCDKDMNVVLAPNTEESMKDMDAALDHLYFYTMEQDTSSLLRGFKIIKDEEYRAMETWSIVFPKNERIVATSRLPDNDVVHSPVLITGDDSLLLKYLNPHIFAVASATTMPDSDQETIPAMVLNLIDSVSGRIIHRISHKHGVPPFRVTQSENAVYYSFWNNKLKRTEMGSLALYDGAISTHGLNLWKRPTWRPTRSSFSSKLPIVLQKSFVFPGAIQAMTTTVTAQGITPKHILVALGTGQIYSLAQKLVDPRRPEAKPTAEQASERLMQYFSYLPVYNNPLAMISYNKTIADIHTITTTGARLESTSLAFAYGLDFFYIRVTPAQSFDLLPEDFNFAMLILLVVGLFVTTLILRRVLKRKQLFDAWK